ncbi:hypothetical protein EW026_g1375 [Hermanssonia centrifuga]|uniref:Uncharacterized protein n=1 Tax=Hermanssonia centrifuga TaxID=98765 RepID=A0A4S4KRL6_9APHY|nr:hypothetical protein EW026_g1375 [Hermanssonia centrifuga]
MCAAVLSSPSTPHAHKQFTAYNYPPTCSSPLASPTSSPSGSPIALAQQRRRSQYKSNFPSSSIIDRKYSSRRVSNSSPDVFYQPRTEQPTPTEEAPRKTVLRERFKARCFERASEERERRVKGKRKQSDWSSDGPDDIMDYEQEDDEADEEFMNDEFFKRIMSSVNSKRKHQYRLSYAHDVGSSFDPDMEDVGQWEQELQGDNPLGTLPEEYDEEELAEYAAEQELLEGLSVNDIFGLSDMDEPLNFDEDDEVQSHPTHKGEGVDIEMDI